ncbi:MAG: hypothetical protein KC503_25675 [Myxococcales bacterium]|nr:hypothetical protein [Myxococcales bacterium]
MKVPVAIAKLVRRLKDSGTDWFFVVAMTVLTVIYALPMVVTKYPPLQDNLAHVKVISIWKALSADPKANRDYQLKVKATPYLTYYGVVRALSTVMPLQLANRLFLIIYALAVPLSVLAMLAVFGRDKRLALLCFPLVYNPVIIAGFTPNAISIPLALFCMATLKWDLSRPSIGRAVLLGVLTIALYFSHVAGFFTFAVTGPVILLMTTVNWRRLLRHTAPVLPALGIAAYWTLQAAGGRHSFRGDWDKIEAKVSTFLRWLNDTRVDGRDTETLVWAGATLLVALLTAQRLGRRGDRTNLCLTICLLGLLTAFLLLPRGIKEPFYHWSTAARLVFPAALMMIVAAPVSLRGRLWATLLVPTIVASGIHGIGHIRGFRTVDRVIRPLENLVESMPSGKRVLVLHYTLTAGPYRTNNLLHATSLVEILRGGRTSDGLIAKEVIPIAHKTSLPSPPDYDEPHKFRYYKHARGYDFVLTVRKPPKQGAPKVLPGGAGFVVLERESGWFALYRINHPQPAVKTPAGGRAR